MSGFPDRRNDIILLDKWEQVAGRLLRRRPWANDLDFIPGADLALFEHLGKYPLARHYAVAHGKKYMAAVVALLADLGNAKERPADPELCADGERGEVNAFGGDIFREITEADIQALFPDFPDALFSEEADLPPRPGVGITLEPVIAQEEPLPPVVLFSA